MHNINLVRTYEHSFPAVIWCVMRILIFYLVWYTKLPIYLVSARQRNYHLVCYLNRKKNSEPKNARKKMGFSVSIG